MFIVIATKNVSSKRINHLTVIITSRQSFVGNSIQLNFAHIKLYIAYWVLLNCSFSFTKVIATSRNIILHIWWTISKMWATIFPVSNTKILQLQKFCEFLGSGLSKCTEINWQNIFVKNWGSFRQKCKTVALFLLILKEKQTAKIAIPHKTDLKNFIVLPLVGRKLDQFRHNFFVWNCNCYFYLNKI